MCCIPQTNWNTTWECTRDNLCFFDDEFFSQNVEFRQKPLPFD